MGTEPGRPRSSRRQRWLSLSISDRAACCVASPAASPVAAARVPSSRRDRILNTSRCAPCCVVLRRSAVQISRASAPANNRTDAGGVRGRPRRPLPADMTRRRTVPPALLVPLLVLVLGQQGRPGAAQQVARREIVISTRLGRLRGRLEYAETFNSGSGSRYYYSFRGVPYAQPPVGDLRWAVSVQRDLRWAVSVQWDLRLAVSVHRDLRWAGSVQRDLRLAVSVHRDLRWAVNVQRPPLGGECSEGPPLGGECSEGTSAGR